ncbi:MAG TPA: YraN family protein [Oculatellaceae cyanobacterium]
MKIEMTIQEAREDYAAIRPSWRIELGKLGEKEAVEYLVRKGWHILAQNWRCGRIGEIDIIARDPDHLLVFCEVKTRVTSSSEFGFANAGFESVYGKKQRKIATLAANFMRFYNAHSSACRFDVLVVEYKMPPDIARRNTKPRERLAVLQTVLPTIRHVAAAFS